MACVRVEGVTWGDFMICTYVDLDAGRKARLLLFLKASGNPLLPAGEAEMERLYGGAAFTQGVTYWSYWRGGDPVATLGAVTEARDAKGEIYLTGICAAPGAFDALDALLQTAELALRRWAPCRLKLGANAFVPGLPEWAEAKGFTFSYRLLAMRLGVAGCDRAPEREKGPGSATDARGDRNSPITWSPVTADTAEAFRQVNNAAFLNSPNGGILDPESVGDLMTACGPHPELLSLGLAEGVPVSALTLVRESDGSGVIDGIAVHPDAQGRGFGRAALRQAVRTLRGLGCDPITLTVMDVNRPAVNLYLQEGFTVERVLSSWYEKAMPE